MSNVRSSPVSKVMSRRRIVKRVLLMKVALGASRMHVLRMEAAGSQETVLRMMLDAYAENSS